jgi:hypothetical protein
LLFGSFSGYFVSSDVINLFGVNLYVVGHFWILSAAFRIDELVFCQLHLQFYIVTLAF